MVSTLEDVQQNRAGAPLAMLCSDFKHCHIVDQLQNRSRPTMLSPSGPRALSVPSLDRNWDDLAIEAQLPWPLGVLLTPKHMEKYNKMFQLLLRLKQVQLALEQSWQELVR